MCTCVTVHLLGILWFQNMHACAHNKVLLYNVSSINNSKRVRVCMSVAKACYEHTLNNTGVYASTYVPQEQST